MEKGDRKFTPGAGSDPRQPTLSLDAAKRILPCTASAGVAEEVQRRPKKNLPHYKMHCEWGPETVP